MSKAVIAGVDTETSGLIDFTVTPNEYPLLLELGVVAYDQELNKVDSQVWVIQTAENYAWALNAQYTHEERNFVENMHMKSGLVHDLIEPTALGATRTFAEMESEFTEFMQRNNVVGSPFMGASVASLDLPVIRHYAPQVMKNFSHRVVDTSSIREMYRVLSPEVSTALEARITEEIGRIRSESVHRTISDVDDCAVALSVIREFAER